MAKFLNTSATTYFLEEMIKSANERLILISPFLKLNDRIKELLEDKNRMKIDVRIIYGKNDLQNKEIQWLQKLEYIRISFCKNLHAKCYLSEEQCIITSLNLYEFSQVNNHEMGVSISRKDDAELYSDSYEEAQRIIRVSDEVRMSLENVNSGTNTAKKDVKPVKNQTETNPNENPSEKLTSSKMAKKLGMKLPAFNDELLKKGFLVVKDGSDVLTPKGLEVGSGPIKGRFGPYFLWDSEFSFKL
jgi:phosphatidylserine/phosphatidylglycerophosphate/cardiolipin synthase-like enzyme